MKHAIIHGTGLIGASVGGALREAGWNVTGWDPEPSIANEALQHGHLDSVAADPPWDGDLVVLAGPPSSVIAAMGTLPDGPLIIDVAGTKSEIEAAAVAHPRFVGTHPMAGREQAGPGHASAALFRGAAWVVVTDHADESALSEVEALVRTMGAIPVRMTAAEHDRAVAAVSHLPQVVAAALVRQASADPHALDLASGSFRDLTRVALSSPDMWADLLSANRSAVAQAVDGLVGQLHELRDVLASDNPGLVRGSLEDARDRRARLAPPVMAVQVVLDDEPGEIARVGRALESSRVDVRDLQLRHGRHGGGGVLTLSVRPGEAETLRGALSDQGFELVE